jgi:hypothetical protein
MLFLTARVVNDAIISLPPGDCAAGSPGDYSADGTRRFTTDEALTEERPSGQADRHTACGAHHTKLKEVSPAFEELIAEHSYTVA